MRPSAVGKRRWLFIGHPDTGRRSAVIYTIIQSCRRYGINPHEYLTDVLGRLTSMPELPGARVLPLASTADYKSFPANGRKR